MLKLKVNVPNSSNGTSKTVDQFESEVGKDGDSSVNLKLQLLVLNSDKNLLQRVCEYGCLCFVGY